MDPSIRDHYALAPSSSFQALDSQIREMYGRTAYSHKTHEKDADDYFRRSSNLKLAQILLSAITTGSLLLAIFGDNHWATVMGAILSTALLALSAYTKDYDFAKIAQSHADVATQLWSVREDYLSLLTEIADGLILDDQILERRNHLQQRLKEIYIGSPRTSSKAYQAAQAALKRDEELTFTAEEIDNLLPQHLRRAKDKTGNA